MSGGTSLPTRTLSGGTSFSPGETFSLPDQSTCPQKADFVPTRSGTQICSLGHHHDVGGFPKKSSYFGPGVWLIIHLMAIRAISDDEITDFMKWLLMILTQMPCSKCVKHATEYLFNHNPEIYRKTKNADGKLVGMFTWTWIFHNSVNKRLDRNMIDFDEAYKMYSPKDTSDVCGH